MDDASLFLQMALTINLDKSRVYRLLLLVFVAGIFGVALQAYLGLSGLAAYSISVSVTVQISNAIEKLRNAPNRGDNSKLSKAEAKALGVNPKKVNRKSKP